MNDYPPPGHVEVSRYLAPATRLLVALVLGVIAAGVGGFFFPWQATPLAGWIVAAGVWVASLWVAVLRLDAVETSVHATAEYPGRAVADGALLAASIASLVAVALLVAKASSSHGEVKAMLLAVSVLSVISSWSVVHSIFTLRYAAIYYTGPDGGIDFNAGDGDGVAGKPVYADFAYVAFTIGMTYQVSDTNLTDGAVRRTALLHALLSYLFGTVIIAVTINAVAGFLNSSG